ncbi:MAG: hypothetical protein JEZ09_19785 [Salinivirgaceae bacterium]|nr:hypothetical protein [Salinivirgaceae bacterium]
MIKSIWTKLSSIGVDENLNMVASRKVTLTNQLAYITFCIVFLMNASFVFIDSMAFDPIGFIMSFIILSTPLLNKYGHHKMAAFIFATLMPISLTMFSSMNKTLMPPPIINSASNPNC